MNHPNPPFQKISQSTISSVSDSISGYPTVPSRGGSLSSASGSPSPEGYHKTAFNTPEGAKQISVSQYREDLESVKAKHRKKTLALLRESADHDSTSTLQLPRSHVHVHVLTFLPPSPKFSSSFYAIVVCLGPCFLRLHGIRLRHYTNPPNTRCTYIPRHDRPDHAPSPSRVVL